MSDDPFDYAAEIHDARNHSTWDPRDSWPSRAELEADERDRQRQTEDEK